MTGSQQEALKRMSKLVNWLMARSDAAPFCEPVDWRGLELFDYPKIITKMMDLGTVKRKLERKQYATAHECAEDIRLIWTNCLTYNSDGSDFWLLAKSISRRFEDRYKKIKAEYNVGENDSSNASENDNKGKPDMISLDMKADLASKIFLLSGMELTHVITMIENRCPTALEQVGKNKVHMEINVDGLDTKLFTDVNNYVQEKVSARHGSYLDEAPEDLTKGNSSSSTKKKKNR
mmetsp:Transcript_29968/g.44305  ORF Transcript_29968/g.44305 Transcript_29968/m.44305 type:complete len:234 (-) Transcript_29968:909-1610(-)